jgi:2-hydroxychromene-2-carboxylate isomerase
MGKPTLDFWFDLASTYSWLTAMRIEPLALAADVEVRWRVFLLGPIFKARGWDTSPFNLYPDKGRYMWRDLERLAQAQGLALVRPEPFPQNSLLAARAALSPAVAPRQAAFCRGVFEAEFAEGKSISEPSTLAGIAAGLDLDADADAGRGGLRHREGAAQGRNGRGPAAGDFRRAEPRCARWRAVLGQRPARAGACLVSQSLMAITAACRRDRRCLERRPWRRDRPPRPSCRRGNRRERRWPVRQRRGPGRREPSPSSAR